MSDNTAISLQAYLEERCDERTRRHELHIRRLEELIGTTDRSTCQKFAGIEQTTKLLAAALEKRLDGMNEFRQALTDQAATYATRKDLESLHTVIETDLRVLRDSRAKLEGAATQTSVTVALLFAALGVIIGVGNILLRMAGK